MRIKIDENMPARLSDVLIKLGHDVETVPEEGLAGTVDDIVWQASQEERRFLITQDLDFSDIRKFAPGTHYGLLLVRLRDPNRAALINKVESIFRSESVSEWGRCLVIATERKVRVRCP